MATRKLSLALAALTTPTFNYQVIMPSFRLGATAVTATAAEMNYLVGVTSAIQTQINAKLATATYTAADVLAKLLTVDGTGTGLDADTLDTRHASYFQVANAASTGASGSVVTTNFSITESGGKLLIKYGATTIIGIESTGHIISIDELEAFGTP
jgi:hypothetical protein